MKGQAVSIDFMAAMVIFVIMIIGGFYFLQNTLVPRQSFTSQVQQAGETAWSNFQDETEWTVHRRPVVVHSDYNLDNEPVEATVPFPGSAVDNSTLVMRNGKELASQHNLTSNRTVFVTRVRNGTTTVDVVWTEEGSLEDRNYSTGLTKGGDSVWNDNINVTFTNSGLSQLEHGSASLLQSNADLGSASSPSFDTDVMKSNVTYSGGGRKHVRIFETSRQIRVTELFSGETEWQFNLTSSFDTVYSSKEGRVVNIDSSGEDIYSATTDWVDFNDSSRGLSIIGENIFVNVSRDSSNSKVEVAINFSDSSGRKDLLLYPHSGDYTDARPQKNEFYNPYEVTVGAREPTEGVSRDKAGSLESKDSETVENKLELQGVSYNISIPGAFKKGSNVDTRTTVVVLQFPVVILERFGNVSVETMDFRVWD